MFYPYENSDLSPDLTKQLREEFDLKYKSPYIFRNPYDETGIGAEDVRKYPDTALDRKLFPSKYNYVFNYFKCHIIRGDLGTWCGYVEFDSPLNYNPERELLVHGGITYESKEEIGFDCHHFNDTEPFRHYRGSYKTYRDVDYVLGQLKSLTEQMFAKLPEWSPQTNHLFPKLYREKMSDLYMLWFLDSDLKQLQTKHLWFKILSQMTKLEKSFEL